MYVTEPRIGKKEAKTSVLRLVDPTSITGLRLLIFPHTHPHLAPRPQHATRW